jgi:tRNA (cytosine38-C5)-methyltransferase
LDLFIYLFIYLFILQIENIYKSLTNLPQEEKITNLELLKLRYFTPKEIANLLGFPPEFGM